MTKAALVWTVSLLIAATFGGCSKTAPIQRAIESPSVLSTEPRAADIRGTFLAVLCDADTSASALVDNQLRRDPAARDLLTILPLPIAESADRSKPWKTRIGQLAVSNSVFGPPTSLALSPDGQYAFVCSSWAQAKQGETLLSQLTREQIVSVIDLRNPSKPTLLSTIDLPGKPNSLEVSPSGELVAIALNGAGHELCLLDRAAISGEAEPLTWSLASLEGFESDVGSISWHSTSRYLAVTLPARNEVAFFEFAKQREDGRPGLAAWGSPVKLPRYPLSGKFTKDGRAFVVACTDWNPAAGVNDAKRVGSLSSIRLSTVPTAVVRGERNSSIPVEHQLVSTVPTGVSPESLAISPDGRSIAVGTWEGAIYPDTDPRFSPRGGLSLYEYSPATTELSLVCSSRVEGLPGGVTFDADGRHIVVSLFRTFDPAAVTGELALFRIDGTKLTEAPVTIGVGPGPHSIMIAK